MHKISLGFLASHRGSNMQSVISACNAGILQAHPAIVISNNSLSGALEKARNAGIPTYHFSAKTHPDPDQLDQAICDALLAHSVDIVILAGYMKKIGSITLSIYQGRILNIHPALLPKFGGKGMYGQRVHQAVLAAKDAETGITIHLVDKSYDTGPIIAQCRIRVLPNDTVETLSKRVLVKEHQFLVETLQRIILGDITLPY